MKSTITKIALTSALLMSSSLFATDITVKVTNLTSGIVFTPLMVAAHPSANKIFTLGSPASANLQAMAEGGDTAGLQIDLAGANIENNANPLAPGASFETSMISTDAGNDYLTIAGMLLPTNDGFVAMNSMKIPTTAGTYTYTLNAYDAGTEANDELVANIPNPGLITSTGATGMAASIEGFVSIHRGNVGDTDATGGKSDLDATKHRFLNPVASVTITVN